jgi:hypothetical protein
MPLDEVAGEVAAEVLGFAGRLAMEVAVDHIFSRHTARFFHGVGRRLIAVATLGQVRIPSSLRDVVSGQRPRPRAADWFALGVGIIAWVSIAVVTAMALFQFF